MKAEQLVYIGLRDVDDGERAFIKDLDILAFSMHDIDRWGIGEVMARALDHLHDRPLHISYDIDAIDPSEAPATGTAVRGGLSKSPSADGRLTCGLSPISPHPTQNKTLGRHTMSRRPWQKRGGCVPWTSSK